MWFLKQTKFWRFCIGFTESDNLLCCQGVEIKDHRRGVLVEPFENVVQIRVWITAVGTLVSRLADQAEHRDANLRLRGCIGSFGRFGGELFKVRGYQEHVCFKR